MTEWTDAVTVLRDMPAGSALYSREQIDGGAWEMAWMIREDTARILALKKSPTIEFRAGTIKTGDVFLLPILVRVGPLKPESIYETWINGYAPDVPNPLGDLAIQPRIVVHLYGDGCELVRSLTVSNQMQRFARDALRCVQSVPPWSMNAFDEARAHFYRDYPTVWDLWKHLTRQGYSFS